MYGSRLRHIQQIFCVTSDQHSDDLFLKSFIQPQTNGQLCENIRRIAYKTKNVIRLAYTSSVSKYGAKHIS